MRSRKAGKVGRRLGLSIGLMCSKTFDDSIFEEFFEAKYGLARRYIARSNQACSRFGAEMVPRPGSLKEGHTWTRARAANFPISPPNTPISRQVASEN